VKVTSYFVRKAIQDYRNEPLLLVTPTTEMVFGRLEGDPDGGPVTAALQRLRAAHSSLLLFHLVQAVDLATSRHDTKAKTEKLAEDHRCYARVTRELYAFARLKVSMRLRTDLPELAKELEHDRFRLMDTRH
jgi:hypothetical protein